MRFVFVDEAGTPENEPTTVVVGIIVNADKQLMLAEKAIAETLLSVPKEFQHEPFHATDVWNKKAYRDIWPLSNRLAFLKNMMSLPRRLELPISLGRIRRDADKLESFLDNKYSRAEFHHMMAFGGCLASVDRYIRERAELSEIATVVAEDIPEMRRFLEKASNVLRDNPVILGSSQVNPTQKEIAQGYIEQNTELRISRIRKNVHFVSKGGDSLLYLADACAFGFRRFFSEQEFGEDFIRAIIGKDLDRQDYSGPSSYVNFFSHSWK